MATLSENELRDSISSLFDPLQESYYTDAGGFTNAVYVQHTKLAENMYCQILNIFDHYGLEYYVFAGSLVGYVRNKKVPLWMDDLDIIVFEDQISLFTDKIVPHLKACGFVSYRPDFSVSGGYQIHTKESTYSVEDSLRLSYTKKIDIKIPGLQVDVFFTTTDSDGFIRNLDKWGLYTHKNIPVSWVKPGVFVNIFNRPVRVFIDYIKDIEKEYGDVYNEIIVATHNQVFLKIKNLNYDYFDKIFNDFIENHIKTRPPCLHDHSDLVNAYDATNLAPLEISGNASFDEIISQIFIENVATIRLSNPNHFFWVIDLRRILPKLNIDLIINDNKYVARATLLRLFVNKISSDHININETIESQIKFLSLAQSY